MAYAERRCHTGLLRGLLFTVVTHTCVSDSVSDNTSLHNQRRLSALFTIIRGSEACEVDGNCARSSRRRIPAVECELEISSGSGPLVSLDLAGLSSDIMFEYSRHNGFKWTRMKGYTLRLGDRLIPGRMVASKGWSSTSGWEICTQPEPIPSDAIYAQRINISGAGTGGQGGLPTIGCLDTSTSDSDTFTFDTSDTTDTSPRRMATARGLSSTSGPDDSDGCKHIIVPTTPQQPLPFAEDPALQWLAKDGMFQGVLAGVGMATFDLPATANSEEAARAACEAVHGAGSCQRGRCGCFRYYFRKGAGSCSCGKAVGEYEWVYHNRDCTGHDHDYVPPKTEVTHSTLPFGDILFLRQRRKLGCEEGSWRLVLHALGPSHRMLGHHCVLDLRSSDYRAGDDTWSGLAGTPVDVSKAVFGKALGAFTWGRGNTEDTIHVQVPVNHGGKREPSTWALWVRCASKTPSYVLGNMQASDFFIDLSNMGAAVVVNEWMHVVKTFLPGGASRTWLNGQLLQELPEQEEASQGEVAAAGAMDTLGLGGGGRLNKDRVWISDLAVWNRTILQGEVQRLYAAGRPSHGGTGTSQFWTASSGACSVSGSCASSPFFPLLAAGSQTCSVQAPREPLTLLAGGKGLALGTHDFHVSGNLEQVAPNNAVVTWTSGVERSTGWLLCSSSSLSPSYATCEDDDTWTDLKYGDGLTTCEGLLNHNASWCFLRGQYSVEAQQHCPRTCGDCQPFQALQEGQTCSGSLLLDTSALGRDSESALACYWHCLALETCTHFEWLAGKLCSRFRGCAPANSTGGLAFIIPGKVVLSSQPPQQKMVSYGYATKQTNGLCRDHLRWTSKIECIKAAQTYYGTEVQVEDAVFHAAEQVCMVKPTGGLSGQPLVFFALPLTPCTEEEVCICRGQYTPESKIILRWDAMDPLLYQLSMTSPVFAMKDPEQELCVRRQGGKCRGTMRRLRRTTMKQQLGSNLAPYLVDWDKDGDTDLLIGRPSGALVYVENIGGVLDMTNAVGLSKLTTRGPCVQYFASPFAFADSHHWCHFDLGANVDRCTVDGSGEQWQCLPATAWGVSSTHPIVPVPLDWDGDGDYDLLVASCKGTLEYWRREEDQSLKRTAGAEDPFRDISGSDCFFPEAVDWDGDGDVDIVLGRMSGRLDYYENEGGILHLRSGEASPFHDVFVESRAAPSATDWDGDGDIDLLVGSGSEGVILFERTEKASLEWRGPLEGLGHSVNSIPRATDVDNDGDIDLLLHAWFSDSDGDGPSIYIWIAEDDDRMKESVGAANPFAELKVGRYAAPQIVDWDGNGRLDVLVGDLEGRIMYHQAADDGVISQEGIVLAAGFALHAVDWDQDGDLDLLAGSSGSIWLHERESSGELLAPRKLELQLLADEGGNPVPFGKIAAPHAVDWDGDGDLDLVVGDARRLAQRGALLHGFGNESLDGWYKEYDGDVLVGKLQVFRHDSQEWIIGFCASVRDPYWFIFPNDTDLLSKNTNGACDGAVARFQGENLLDYANWYAREKDRKTMPGWTIWGELLPDDKQAYEEDGTRFVHQCLTVTLDTAGASQCALDTCKKAGFHTGVWTSFSFKYANDCTDGTDVDLYNSNCSAYADNTGWCGHYDTATFKSSECCACPRSIRVEIVCFNKNRWRDARCVSMEGILPEEPFYTGLRYFENTPGGYKEHGLSSTPFADVSFTDSWPYPIAVDMNKDGRMDIAVGLAAKEVRTIQSDGSSGAPWCVSSFQRYDFSCKPWGIEKFQACAEAMCFSNGYDSAKVLKVGNCNICNATLRQDFEIRRDDLDQITSEEDLNHVPRFPVSGADGCTWQFESNEFDSYSNLDSATSTDSSDVFNPEYSTSTELDLSGACKRRIPSIEAPKKGHHLFNPDSMRTETLGGEDEINRLGVGILALCGRGGQIQFWEQEESGLVKKKAKSESAFGAVSTTRSAVPSLVDWDGDGKTDLVVGDDSGTLRFFQEGDSCQTGTTCRGRGYCDRILGTCSCVQGHGRADCSSCRAGYYSRRLLHAYTAPCKPCPGAESGNTCAGRGFCNDDDFARSTTGNPLATGNGSCSCSPFFYGTNQLGLTDCTLGECPAGQELRVNAAGIEECMLCPRGFHKSAAGNHACEECPRAHFSPEGATTCSPCPGGEYNELPGQGFCKPCAPASFSANASSTCTLCVVGRYADQTGSSECSVCPAGRWSSNAGMSLCAACPAGRYSLGREECLACESGGYSSVEGSSGCKLCGRGRYNPSREAPSSTSCQPCAAGKYSRSIGARSKSSCLLCEFGATTPTAGSTNASACIMPSGANFSCVSGRPCLLSITGSGLVPGHRMALASLADGQRSLVPSGITERSASGTAYTWLEPLVLGGGSYELLWCAGLHGACGLLADFPLSIGQLEVAGPVATSFTCTRGRPCSALGPVAGTDLQSTDEIRVLRACGDGPVVAITADNGEGKAMDATIDADGALTFGFGAEPVSANPHAAYEVCWCAMGRGQQGGCSSEPHFLVRLGTLALEGSNSGQERSCYLGQPCKLEGLEGHQIKAGDRLMVLDRCGKAGQRAEGVPGAGIAETQNGADFEFLGGKGQLLLSVPGLLRLCYCRPTDGSGGGCEGPGDFEADTGFFTAKGPYDSHKFPCFVGAAACDLKEMQGIGLGDGDEVAVRGTADERACESNETQGSELLGLQSTEANAYNAGKDFSLGSVLSDAKPGRYRLCWRPKSSAAFRAAAGYLFISCPSGTYRLRSKGKELCLPCPLGFYCSGGTLNFDFQDDFRVRCPEGTTTQNKSAGSAGDCLCAPGFKFNQLGECEQCPVARFKSRISNERGCSGECPNGTTSLLGAVGESSCFSTGPVAVPTTPGKPPSVSLVPETKPTSDVFVLEGQVHFPACLAPSKLEAAKTQLKATLADSLGVQPRDVLLKMGSQPACSGAGNAARRLQAGLEVTYQISMPSQAEADRLSQNIDGVEIQAAMENNLAISVTMDAPPIINREVLDCSSVGVGKSFPLGSQPLSVAECVCSIGFEPTAQNTAVCQPCPIGSSKGLVGNLPCKGCSSVPVVQGNVSGPASRVGLTTLAAGAMGEHFCFCPPGYHFPRNPLEAPSQCLECGMGFFCPSGGQRVPCPHGTSTVATTSEALEDCVCAPGFFPLGPLARNNTHRCLPCEAGRFKAGTGDLPCDQSCMGGSTSLPSAKSSSDCFCRESFYFLEALRSCVACPPDGVECPGGFDPPGSRVHAAPVSRSGYYLTNYADAESCDVFLEDGSSVCNAGATFADSSTACDKRHTGVICGACVHRTARDLGDLPCEDCSDLAPVFRIFNLALDLFLKALFGIFLGKQAMDSATKTRKMESVIIRIALQWVSACSVLAAFDLSRVKLYGWSQEELQMEIGTDALQSVSGEFQFPEWFRPLWRTMTLLTGTVPSPVSPQYSMECLVQNEGEAPKDLPPLNQLLAPALWWLFYPIMVLIFVFIISLLLAKLAFPVSLYLLKRAKSKLRSRLATMGVSKETAQEAAESMRPAHLESFLSDPSSLGNVKGMAKGLGRDVVAEAAASFVMEKAAAEHLEMLQTLCEGGGRRRTSSSSSSGSNEGPSDYVVVAAKRVQAGGLPLLKPFLIEALWGMQEKDLEQLWKEPKTMPPRILAHLRGMSDWDAYNAFAEDGEEPPPEPLIEGNQLRASRGSEGNQLRASQGSDATAPLSPSHGNRSQLRLSTGSEESPRKSTGNAMSNSEESPDSPRSPRKSSGNAWRASQGSNAGRASVGSGAESPRKSTGDGSPRKSSGGATRKSTASGRSSRSSGSSGRRSRRRSREARTTRNSDIEALNFSMEEEEEYEEEGGGASVAKEYPVFGLFRSTNVGDVLRGALPLGVVTLYSIWDVVTRRLLGLIQVRTILISKIGSSGVEEREVQSRWLYDMRFLYLSKGHLAVGIIGFIGLGVWSIGLLAALIWQLRRNKNQLQDKHMARRFGYFYNGLKPKTYYWEIVMKKADILVLYVVTFSDIFPDHRAKLIMYLGMAGVVWSLHNLYHPYNDRCNSLADRLEDTGLTTRFFTFLIVQMLLMINADPQLNAFMAVFIIVINMKFLLTVMFLLVIEVPGMQHGDEAAKQKASDRMTSRAAEMFDFGSNPLTQAASKVLNIVVGKVIKPVMVVLLRIMGEFSRVKGVIASKVPHMQWQGVGMDLLVITHEKEKLPWYERCFAVLIHQFYRLGDEDQKTFLSRTVGQFWDYILNNSECHQLPSCIMDIFFVLPTVLKAAREEEDPQSSEPLHVRVARGVNAVLRNRPSRQQLRLSKSSRTSESLLRGSSFSSSKGLPAHTSAGEDFNAALLFIQRLPKSDVHDFLVAALVDIDGGCEEQTPEQELGKQTSI